MVAEVSSRSRTAASTHLWFDPDSQAVYAGADGALLASRDGGLTFAPYNDTFTRSAISSVVAVPGGNPVCESIDGVFEVLGPELLGVPEIPMTSATERLEISPNPARDRIEIHFSDPGNRRADIGIGIFDPLGRKVGATAASRNGNGTFTAKWNVSSLPRGAYVVRAGSVEGKLLLLR